MDRPSRPPEPPSKAAKATSEESREKATSVRRTAALPAPDLIPRRQRPGVHTEALEPPPPVDPSKAPPAPLGGPTAPQTGAAPAHSRVASAPAPSGTGPATARPAIPPRRPRPTRPPSSGLRIAARPRPQVPRSVAWGATLVLMLGAGWCLWLSRASLNAAFDRWLSLPSWQQQEAPPEIAPVAVRQPTTAEAPDEGPVWTFESIDEALRPLPEQIQALSDAGKSEQENFADLARRKAPAALQRSRWENWRLVWRNRTSQLRQAMPPLEVCLPHAALETTCLATDEALEALERIVELPIADPAMTDFACADTVLAAWRKAEEEAAAAAQAEDEAAADGITEPGVDDADGEAIEVEDLLRPDG